MYACEAAFNRVFFQLVFLGATLSVAFASKNSPEYTLDQLLGFYRNPNTGISLENFRRGVVSPLWLFKVVAFLLLVIYFCMMGIFIVVHYLLIRIIEKQHLTSRKRLRRFSTISKMLNFRFTANSFARSTPIRFFWKQFKNVF
jgi:hypothetical protein